MTVTRHPARVDETTDSLTSPGHRLREARLEAKLTVDEVAARLHLDPRLVEALENDRHGELPEATFVRGYLRGYARLLDLPPAPIIESYDRHGFQAPELIPDIASKPQVQSSDTAVRLVTFAIVGVLIGLVGAWWWQKQQSPVAVEHQPPSVSDAVQDRPEPSRLAATEPAPRAITRTAPPSLAAVQQPSPERKPLRLQPAESVSAAITAPEPSPIPPPDPVAESSSEVSVEPPTAVTPPEIPGDESSVAESEPAIMVLPEDSPPLPDRLVIRLKHDSWIEVYDRDGNQLYFGLAKGGTQVAPNGPGPMSVLVGYARDARVEYNSAVFDLAPHTRQDVARFTVGKTPTEPR